MSAFHLINIRFDQDMRFANQAGESFNFPAGSELPGSLSMVPTLGPHGVREYEHPHMVDVSFEFRYNQNLRRYRGLLSQFDLWFASGARVERNNANFAADLGPIDGMMDDREDCSYILPDGRVHTFRLKYCGCTFDIMLQDDGFLIRCRYHDLTAGTNLIIYYPKKFTDFIFLPAPKLCFAGGVLDEVYPHGEQFVSIE